jgi:hypothetical protein
VGHSLGAGTAAILCILLRREFPATTCFSFSPPGGLLRYSKYRGGRREKGIRKGRKDVRRKERKKEKVKGVNELKGRRKGGIEISREGRRKGGIVAKERRKKSK